MSLPALILPSLGNPIPFGAVHDEVTVDVSSTMLQLYVVVAGDVDRKLALARRPLGCFFPGKLRVNFDDVVAAVGTYEVDVVVVIRRVVEIALPAAVPSELQRLTKR